MAVGKKITEKQFRSIKSDIRKGISRKEIMDKHLIGKSTYTEIAQSSNWESLLLRKRARVEARHAKQAQKKLDEMARLRMPQSHYTDSTDDFPFVIDDEYPTKDVIAVAILVAIIVLIIMVLLMGLWK